MNEKNIILSCKCWKELDLKLRNLTTNNQTVLGGSTFALFLKYYLETSSIYASKLEKIWLLDEVDSSIKIKLNLPNRDEGIDLIAKTFDEKYWAIQAKYRSDFNSSLTVSGKGSLASFNNLAFGYCKNISYGLVASTVNKSPKKTYLLNKDIGYLTLDAFLELDEPSNHHWNNIIQKVNDNFVSIKNEIPKPHQSTAVSKCINYFKKNNVGKLFMPCGTGKTLVSSTLARKIQAKSVLIVVPSLNLVSQMLKHWTKEFIGNGILSDWIIVCSDKTVTNDKNDDTFKGFIHDLGVPTTTDVNYVKEFLQNNNDRIKIVIVTYQSGNIVSSASKLNKFTFDLAIFDEAHKTVGHKEKVKAILLQEKNINIKKRLFMTATERTFKKNDKEFVSMDNQNIYGRTIHTLTFKDAIQQKEPIISDYKVITFEVTDKDVEDCVNSNKFIKIRKNIDNLTAREFAVALGLRKAMKQHKIQNAISFHRSIERAKNFKTQQDSISELFSEYKKINTFHIYGSMKINERINQIREFTRNKGLMTNARCLTEGIDIPAIDCVCFVDPKRSKIDIVQAAGRAMRLSKGKKFGYIVVPIFTSNEDLNLKNKKNTGFEEVINVIGHLSTNDTRISENLRAIHEGRKPKKGSPIDEILSLNVITKVDKKIFEKSLQLKIWDSIANFNYRSFEESKRFARSLMLNSYTEWKKFVKLNNYKTKIFPPDIPRYPEIVYKDKFKSFPDFLGYFTRNDSAIDFVSYTKAKEWVNSKPRNKIIKKQVDWIKFTRDNYNDFEKFPINIPINPQTIYKNKGWIDYENFLNYKAVKGADYRSSLYLTHDKAMDWVKKNINKKFLSINDWFEYIKNNKVPEFIPNHLPSVYKDKGWKGPAHFFGYEFKKRPRIDRNNALTYDLARKLIKPLNFKNENQFHKYINKNSQNFDLVPLTFPTNPDQFYKDNGWISWDDFLGIDNKVSKQKKIMH